MPRWVRCLLPQPPKGPSYASCLLDQHTNHSFETIQVCVLPSCTSEGLPKVRTISLHLGAENMEDGRGKLSNVGRFLKNIHVSCLLSVRAGHLLLALLYALTVTAHYKGFAYSVMAVYSLVEVSEIWLFWTHTSYPFSTLFWNKYFKYTVPL